MMTAACSSFGKLNASGGTGDTIYMAQIAGSEVHNPMDLCVPC
jgi:hypothetical protein